MDTGDCRGQDYRVIQVQETDLPTLAPGFRPMRTDEFQSRLRQWRQRGKDDHRGARIEQALYVARWENGQLVDGVAQWQVSPPAGNSEPLAMGACNLPMRDAMWQDAEPLPAVLGTGADGETQLLVSKSGTLTFRWNKHGDHDPFGLVRFPLRLPPAPVNRIEIEVPAGYTLLSSHGITTRLTMDREDVPGKGESKGEGRPQESWTRWRIDLGAAAGVELQVVSNDPASPTRPFTVYRQQSSYAISSEGIRLTEDFRLRIVGQSLKRMQLQLEDRVQLTRIRHGATEIAWTQTKLPGSSDSIVTLDFPEPLAGANESLRLFAIVNSQRTVAAGQGATDNEAQAVAHIPLPLQLPRMRPLDMVWQESNATVSVEAPWELKRLITDQCQQTGLRRLALPQRGEEAEFQFFAADGQIAVTLDRITPKLHAQTGTTVIINGEHTRGEMIAELTSARGDAFSIVGVVPDGWNVETIVCDPSDQLQDWRTIPNLGETGRQLQIDLKTPLQPGRPLQLALAASRERSAPGALLDANDFQIVLLREVTIDRRLIDLRAESPLRIVQLEGTPLEWLDATNMPKGDASLIAAQPGDYVFACQRGTSDLRFQVQGRNASYNAETMVTMFVTETRIDEQIRIHCRPIEGEGYVNRLLVQVIPASDDSWKWRMSDDPDQPLLARKLSLQQQQQLGIVLPGELWEITPTSTAHADLVVVGDRARDITGTNASPALTLCQLPQATQQTSQISIQMSDETPPVFQLHESFRRLSGHLNASPDRRQRSVTFSYEAAALVDAQRPSTFRRSGEPTGDKQGIVHQLHLTTALDLKGRRVHSATFVVNTQHRSSVNLTLPEGQKISRVTVDGIEVANPRVDSANNRVSLPVPVDKNDTLLEVIWTESRNRVGLLSTLTPAWPSIDCVVCTRRWTVQLPSCLNIAARPPAPPPPLGFFTRSDGRSDYSSRQSAPFPPEPIADRRREFAGLHSHEIPLSRTHISSIYIYRRAWWIAIGWGSFFLAGLFAILLRRRFLLVIVPVAAMMGAVAIWLVPPGSFVVQAIAAGVLVAYGLAGLGLQHLCGERGNDRSRSHRTEFGSPSSLTTTIRGTASSLVFLLIWCGVGGAIAQDTVQDTARESTQGITSNGIQGAPVATPKQQEVFVLVDDELKRTTDYVYVSPQFYAQLVGPRHDDDNGGDGWLVRSADYRIDLASDARMANEPRTETIRASYQCELFGHTAFVSLPWEPSEWAEDTTSIYLDGRPVLPVLNGGKMSIYVEGEGRHRLEWAVRIDVRATGADNAIEMSIPAVADSRLTLFASDSIAALRVPSAEGRVQWDRASGRCSADLGPTKRLAIEWTTTNEIGSDAAEPIVDELVWLRVQPGAVTLEAQLTLPASDVKLRRVRVVADANLRLLPQSQLVPTYSERISDGQLQRWTFDINDADAAVPQLQLRFLVTRASGIGNLSVPRVELSGYQIGRRLLGVSVDSSLTYEINNNIRSTRLPVEQFRALWNGASDVPLLAVDLTNGEHVWSINTQVRPGTVAVDQQLELSCGLRRWYYSYTGHVRDVIGERYHCELTVPRGLIVESIEVYVDEQLRECRWSPVESNLIDVLMVEALSKPHRIELRGYLICETPAEGEELTTTTIELVNSNRSTLEWRVMREEDTNVEILATDGMIPATGADAARSGLTVARFLQQGAETPELRVRTTPNVCQLIGQSVIRLLRDEATWYAELKCHATILEGKVDTLSFSLPDNWEPSPQTAGEFSWQTVQVRKGERRLILQRNRDAGNDVQFTIRGLLDTTEGVQVPRIVPWGTAKSLDEYIVFPTRIGNEMATWELQQLTPIDQRGIDSLDLFDGLNDMDAWKACQVRGPQADARLSTRTMSNASIRMPLIDVSVGVDRDGYTGCMSCYTIPSQNGNDDLRLSKPADMDLLAIRIDDEDCPFNELPDGNWRIMLERRQLPFRIDIYFRAPLHSSMWGSTTVLVAPRPFVARVDRMLWSVGSTARVGRSWRMTGDQACDATTQTTQRKDALAGITPQVPVSNRNELRKMAVQPSALASGSEPSWSVTLARPSLVVEHRVQIATSALIMVLAALVSFLASPLGVKWAGRVGPTLLVMFGLILVLFGFVGAVGIALAILGIIVSVPPTRASRRTMFRVAS